MSEPSRSTPARRDKLAAALKRNMARRKVASRQSPDASEANSKRLGDPCVAEGEPLAAGVSEAKGTRSPSIKRLP